MPRIHDANSWNSCRLPKRRNKTSSKPAFDRSSPGLWALVRGSFEGQSVLFATDVPGFQVDPVVQEEVFGAASVIVRCPDVATMRSLVENMEGQLTATLQLDDPADIDAARILLPVLERKVGRVLVNGWPTGVEVGHAMVHGGSLSFDQ